jgi:4-diphosphocytidyl-2-C-methyl-D-erythritol kinase
VTVRLLSPAKINLGLEILGKRPDGFHEVRTILHAVSLFDELDASASTRQRLTINDPRLDHSENLAVRAAHLWSEEIDPRHRSLDLRLTKRIPAAAGLGGASSNAAGVLMIANALYDLDPDPCGCMRSPPGSALMFPFFSMVPPPWPLAGARQCAQSPRWAASGWCWRLRPSQSRKRR